MLTLVIFLVILLVLVLIHELGHFLVAKKLGIKVEEFGFGFPPKAFSVKKGETVYSVNWLPIGGFVKLFGEDEAGGGSIKIPNRESQAPKTDIQRAFFARPVWQRASIVVAGVVMNTLLAVAIFYVFLAISNFQTKIPLFGEYRFFGVEQENRLDGIIVQDVAKDSPAEKAGFTKCDSQKTCAKITAINNITPKTTKEFVAIVQANKGKEVILTWEDLRTSKKYQTHIVPRVNPPKGQGSLGIVLGAIDVAVLRFETPTQKLFSGVVYPINLVGYQMDILGKLIAVSFKERTVEPVGEGFAGPVGIFNVLGGILEMPTLRERILGVLNLAGLLSISLALFNILPIPALDGGRLFFILIEGVTGKKVSPKVEAMIHTIGMAILLFLMLLITAKDIRTFFFR